MLGHKLYLSPVTDLYNGEIVAYQMSERPVFEMVSRMLRKALAKLGDHDRPMLHSDQGWQGGFNRSSQHLKSEEVLHGSKCKAGVSVDGASSDVLTGCAVA